MPLLKSPQRPRRNSSSSVLSNDSDSHSSLEEQGSTSKRPPGILKGIKVKIIDAKLTADEVGDLVELAESVDARPEADPYKADIIITEIGAIGRLERHIKGPSIHGKAIVNPNWLKKSVKAGRLLDYEPYLAIPSLKPPFPRLEPKFHPTAPVTPKSNIKFGLNTPKATPKAKYNTPDAGTKGSPIVLSDSEDMDEEIEYDAGKMPRWSVMRKAPLSCPNDELVAQLAVIKRERWLKGEERNALSYGRAIASIKAYPKKIQTVAEAEKLPFVGPKTKFRISEYLTSGMITECRRIQQDAYINTLVEFTKIYGIGPETAKDLYTKGLRNMQDLELYYRQQLKLPNKRKRAEDFLSSLALRHDFEVKISRAEVEEVARLLEAELEKILPGFVHTIVGGYRRGKPESNDIDIVFSHRDASRGREELNRMVRRMQRGGLITHLLPASSFRTPGGLKSYTEDQAVQRIMTVFAFGKDAPSFPNNPAGQPRKHRRLDIIFSPPEAYWCTVVGWTGSIIFERDLRLYCKQVLDLKFDSTGLVRRQNLEHVPVKSERHLFELLGLPYIEPEFRNCDYSDGYSENEFYSTF